MYIRLSRILCKIQVIPDELFKHAWSTSSNRTELYENQVLEKVASKLYLVYKKEEFKVDYTLTEGAAIHPRIIQAAPDAPVLITKITPMPIK